DFEGFPSLQKRTFRELTAIQRRARIGEIATERQGVSRNGRYATQYLICIAASVRLDVGRDPASERRITRDGAPMHTPPLALIIVERAMLGAEVVPDGQRTHVPAETEGELQLHRNRRHKITNPPPPP